MFLVELEKTPLTRHINDFVTRCFTKWKTHRKPIALSKVKTNLGNFREFWILNCKQNITNLHFEPVYPLKDESSVVFCVKLGLVWVLWEAHVQTGLEVCMIWVRGCLPKMWGSMRRVGGSPQARRQA